MSPALAGRFFTTSTTWNDIVPTVSHNKDKDERKRCEQKVQSIHMVRIINNFQHSKGDIMRGNAQSLQSCPTLSNPMDGSPPGSPVPGILQARTLEWVAISFFNA